MNQEILSYKMAVKETLTEIIEANSVNAFGKIFGEIIETK